MKKQKYRNFGEVDFKDYQLENAEEQCEKDMEEIEGEEKDEN